LGKLEPTAENENVAVMWFYSHRVYIWRIKLSLRCIPFNRRWNFMKNLIFTTKRHQNKWYETNFLSLSLSLSQHACLFVAQRISATETGRYRPQVDEKFARCRLPFCCSLFLRSFYFLFSSKIRERGKQTNVKIIDYSSAPSWRRRRTRAVNNSNNGFDGTIRF